MTEQAKTIITLRSVVGAARDIAVEFDSMLDASYSSTIYDMVEKLGRRQTAEMLASDDYTKHLHDNFVATSSERFEYDKDNARFNVRVRASALVEDEDAILALSLILSRHLCRQVTVMHSAQAEKQTGTTLVAEFSRSGIDVRPANKVNARNVEPCVAMIRIPLHCDDQLKLTGILRDPTRWAASVRRIISKQFKKGKFDGVEGGKETVRQFEQALGQWEDESVYTQSPHYPEPEVEVLPAPAIGAVLSALENLSDEALDIIDHFVLFNDMNLLCEDFSEKEHKKLKKFFKDSPDHVTRLSADLIALWLKYSGDTEDFGGLECLLGGKHQIKNRVAGFVAAFDLGEWPEGTEDFRSVLNK